MAPPRQDTLGERISGVEATLGQLDKYQHERWHELNNRLQPLFGMPEQLAREVGRMQGNFEGRIGAVTKEIERSITAAVEKAIEPLNRDVAMLKADVEELKAARLQDDGAKTLAKTIINSPIAAGLIGALMAAAAVAWAFLTGKAQT